MIHSPELSAKNWALIEAESPIKFIDSSYGNDCTDSIYNEDHDLIIYLPNVAGEQKREDEVFNTFALNINSSDGFGGDYLEIDGREDLTLEQVIQYLKDNYSAK